MSIRPLSDDLQKKAEAELNEVPSIVPDSLEDIRIWLQAQLHLNAREDDQWLLCFLRGCKFDLQKTKKRIDYFYTIRTLVPEFFQNRDPFSPEIQEMLAAGVMLPLPMTSAGPRVFLFRWTACDVNRMSILNIAKVFYMFMDVFMIEDDNFMVAGEKVLIDFHGCSLRYILQLTPGIIQKAVSCFQSAYPVRAKALIFLNVPSAFEGVLELTKMFLNEKLKSRMHCYSKSNFHKVCKHVPLSLLPEEYGGSNVSIDDIAADWKKRLESYREWFLEDTKYGATESLRPRTPRSWAMFWR